MLKKCKLIMLLTNEKASLKLGQNGLLVNNTFGYDSHFTNQYLYFLSDEEIKDGDMCINSFDNKIWRYKTIPCPLPYWGNKKTLKKIIASTDISLKLPEIQECFINTFIEQYNKGNIIKEVSVEYEEYRPKINDGWGGDVEFRLKVDKNNCIVITKLKES